LQRSSVESTSREAFALPAGKTFTLPQVSSAYVAIPIIESGDIIVEVVDNEGKSAKLDCKIGNMVYLKGTMGLRCFAGGGESAGRVVCIMLSLNFKEQ
jgi:hypothetical protein